MNTRVGSKAELLRCVTQAGYEVKEGGNIPPFHKLCRAQLRSETFKNEKLDVSGWGAGSEESDEENEEEDSGDDDEDESEEDGPTREQSAADGKTSVAAKNSAPEPGREAGDAKIGSSANNKAREDGNGGGSPEVSAHDKSQTGLGLRPSDTTSSSQESGKPKPPEKTNEGYRESTNESSDGEDEESSSGEGNS